MKNPIVNKPTLCLFRPKHLISLWDMIKFYTDGLSDNLNILASTEREAEVASSIYGKEAEFAAKERRPLRALLTRMILDDAVEWQMADIPEQIHRFDELLNHGAGVSNELVRSKCASLRGSIMNSFRSLTLAFVPLDKKQFFEKDGLFGDGVRKAFPSVEKDLKEAGDCLALDLHTAAVFHLMRVTELGVKALARKLRVPIKGGIEFSDWKGLKQAVGKKLDALAMQPRGKKKADALEFYRRILADFGSFEETRNSVMHSRASFGEHEARGIYERVKDFMTRLAVRISE